MGLRASLSAFLICKLECPASPSHSDGHSHGRGLGLTGKDSSQPQMQILGRPSPGHAMILMTYDIISL